MKIFNQPEPVTPKIAGSKPADFIIKFTPPIDGADSGFIITDAFPDPDYSLASKEDDALRFSKTVADDLALCLNTQSPGCATVIKIQRGIVQY